MPGELQQPDEGLGPPGCGKSPLLTAIASWDEVQSDLFVADVKEEGLALLRPPFGQMDSTKAHMASKCDIRATVGDDVGTDDLDDSCCWNGQKGSQQAEDLDAKQHAGEHNKGL